jgi:predicted nuclease of predicted toxin-antitoxin system
VRILVDENIPRSTVASLREMGHDVLDVRGTAAEGSADSQLWERAQSERRLLITTDAGFAFRRQEDHAGILIVRLRQPNRHRIHQRVMEAIGSICDDDWRGLLVSMRDTVQSVWRNR